MKININIDKDLVKLQKQLGSLKSKHLPFAVAKALNELAGGAQAIIRKEFEEELEIRNKGLLKKSIQINWAQKSDWPYTESEVGILANFSFLADHATGTVRHSRGSLGRAIPKEVKRGSSGKVPAGKKPGILLQKNKAFIMKAKSGKRLLVARKGKERLPVTVFYALHRDAKIRDIVDFNSKVDRMFNREFDSVIGKHLARAIATSK